MGAPSPPVCGESRGWACVLLKPLMCAQKGDLLGTASISASLLGDAQSRQTLVEELRRGLSVRPPGLKPSPATQHCDPTRKPNTVQGEEHLGWRLSCGSDRRVSHLLKMRRSRGVFDHSSRVKSDHFP